MLVSVFLRHYKIFKNLHYIPVADGQDFTAYIGENGVGKSSVLEAFDEFFNSKDTRDWNINKQAKFDRGMSGGNTPFIAPVFLIPEKKIAHTQKHFRELTETLSGYFWHTTYRQDNSPELQRFYEHREKLKAQFDEKHFFLVLAGKRYNIKSIFFGLFHDDQEFKRLFLHEKEQYEGQDDDKDNIEEQLQNVFDNYLDQLLELYSYIYIPVETDLLSYTKLETVTMQKLMDKNIREAIESAIGEKTIDAINKNLDLFIEDVHSTLDNYKYKGVYKNSLKMSDLIGKIIEAYFSIKILHKRVNEADLQVDTLSSGEKRKALIDVAYSFLKRGGERDQKVILAIDEPEASLHISACYDQFEKLKCISRLGTQILITTHWYGFLPIMSEGVANSMMLKDDFDVEITEFNLYNYRERIKQDRARAKGKLPYDINLKSYNDLVQAVVTSARKERAYNWLICEGTSERVYFEYYFEEELRHQNLRILSVGGGEEVVRIYEYLQVPMKEKDLDVQGKIFCLIDTDEQSKDVDTPVIKNLELKRLLNLPDKGTVLAAINSNVRTPPTEIEDALEPDAYYLTLKQFNDPNLEELLADNPKLESARNSYECLDLRPSDLAKLKAFFDTDNHKYEFAKKYVEVLQQQEKQKIPAWIEEIKKFYQ